MDREPLHIDCDSAELAHSPLLPCVLCSSKAGAADESAAGIAARLSTAPKQSGEIEVHSTSRDNSSKFSTSKSPRASSAIHSEAEDEGEGTVDSERFDSVVSRTCRLFAVVRIGSMSAHRMQVLECIAETFPDAESIKRAFDIVSICVPVFDMPKLYGYSTWKSTFLAIVCFDRGRSFVREPLEYLLKTYNIKDFPEIVRLSDEHDDASLDAAITKALKSSSLAYVKKKLNR
jgi:hypothetical protein